MSKGFYPKALVLNIPPGSNDPPIKPRIAILHVDAGNAFSLYSYFKDRSGGVESHFHVRKDGVVEQYRSIYFQADANLNANDYAVSIETQGLGHESWNEAQLKSIKALLLWLHKEAGIPLHKCTGPAGTGVGYHIQFGSPGPWTPVAKACPGPKRIAQYNNVLVPWMKSALRPKVVTNVAKARKAITNAIKHLSNANPKRKKADEAEAALREVRKNLPKR